jgi:hypothetical protein
MITLSLILKNLRLIFIIALIAGAIWLYKDWQFQKAENIRQTENNSQNRKYDSLRFTSQSLTKDEIKEYLQYQNPDLQKKLENSNIKLNRIESIVSNLYKYKDTSTNETDVSGLISAIKSSIPKTQTWIDSTKCLTTKGTVSFDGQKLKVIVNDREFKNKSDGVAYWQRKEWSLFGIKTRFLGKKEFTAKQFDECGESKTMKIEKKK